MLNGAYQSIYELISNAIFNGAPDTATYGIFMCESISAIACTFLLALPFLIVYRIIRRFI